MSIQRLTEQVIAKIAAGEVIERPASVVKELLENALDAEAGTIKVETNGGGGSMIRISDDGNGIHADDMPLVFERHATSKLRDSDDLYQIRTLGFRGEALSSISAVSQTTLMTRHRDESVGREVRIEGGRVVNRREIGAPAGTIITVENLFYNTPVRRKFMKSDATEKRQIATIITNYAMAYPQVRFILVQDGREVFRSSGSGELSDVVVKVFGLSLFKQMVEVSDEDIIRGYGGSVGVRGYVSEPDLHRKDRSKIQIFVNGRDVQDNTLTYAVTQAYHSLMPKGRYPYAVLLVSVPSDFVDVNVHPTKAEVRFQDANAVFSTIQRAVREGVIGYAQVQSGFARPRRLQASENIYWDEQDEQLNLQMAADGTILSRNRATADTYPDYDEDGEPIEHSQRTRDDRTRDDRDDIVQPPGEDDMEQAGYRPRTLPLLRVIGQIGATYIIAEGPAGLYLIDQHAADARIIYEALLSEYQQRGHIEPLDIEAQTVDLSGREARMIQERLDLFGTLGVKVESFGPTSFVVRSLPATAPELDAETLLAMIIRAIVLGKPVDDSDIILGEIAQASAVRAGQVLKPDDQQALVRRLERTPSPTESLTGQPTFIHISASQLAHEFKGNDTRPAT